VAAGLGDRLGKQVVVDNRAGGNSIIGTEIAAKAPADGYTLLVISTSFTTNPIIHKLPYDSLKAFSWVAFLGYGPNVLAVNNSHPANSVKELVALAKAKPGQLVYASTGVGSNAHFGTELFKHMTGTDMLHVPYKGGGPALLDTVSGRTQICLSSLIQAIGHIRSGRLRALATSGEKRALTLPDVPTIAESGVPGYEAVQWYGVLAPAQTPRDIVTRLHREMMAILQSSEVKERFAADGGDAGGNTPEEFARYIRTETEKWARVAKTAGIKPE
jgi:tripartite-type tricarboxylate transporter receptor subunit TctC